MNHKAAKTLTIVASLIIAILSTRCAEEDMLLSYQHTLQVGLYSMHTHKDTSLTNVQIYGIGREDSLLYDEPAVSALFLNLNMNTDSTKYVFKTQTLQDELTITYDKHLTPVSGSGGITMELHVNSIAHTQVFIDSVAIVNRNIKYNESLENVKIFVY